MCSGNIRQWRDHNHVIVRRNYCDAPSLDQLVVLELHCAVHKRKEGMVHALHKVQHVKWQELAAQPQRAWVQGGADCT